MNALPKPFMARLIAARRVDAFAACVVVLGASLWLVQSSGILMLGSVKWTREVTLLLRPYLLEPIHLSTFFAPGPDRVAGGTNLVGRLLSVVLFKLNGCWDPILEVVAAVGVRVTAVAALFKLLSSALGDCEFRWSTICALAVLVIPLGWENVLDGLQSPIFALEALSIVSIFLLTTSTAFTARWFVGTALGALSFLCFPSGALTLLPPIALIGGQSILGWRNGIRERVGIAVQFCIFGALLFLGYRSIGISHAANLVQWAVTYGGATNWPFPPTGLSVVVVNVPVAGLAYSIMRDRARPSDPRWTYISLWLWVQAMLASIAYATPASVTQSRYLDIAVLGLIVNAACCVLLLKRYDLGSPRRMLVRLTVVLWAAAICITIAVGPLQVAMGGLAARSESFRNLFLASDQRGGKIDPDILPLNLKEAWGGLTPGNLAAPDEILPPSNNEKPGWPSGVLSGAARIAANAGGLLTALGSILFAGWWLRAELLARRRQLRAELLARRRELLARRRELLARRWQLWLTAPFETLYGRWVAVQKALASAEKPELMRHLSTMTYLPKINVIVDMAASPNVSDASLRDTLTSIEDQLYGCSEVIIKAPKRIECEVPVVAEMSATVVTELPADTLNADFLVFVLCGDRLHPSALYRFAAVLNAHPDTDLLYADEDRIDSDGERSAPFVKPGWSPDYLETFNYIGYPACVRATLLTGHLHRTYYDILLRVTEQTDRIKHLQEFLCHCKSDPKQRGGTDQNIAALEGRLARTGRSGIVTESNLAAGCYTIKPQLKRSPRISIIIPSSGRPKLMDGRKVEFLRDLVEQINDSIYPDIEIIVATYPALAPARIAWLERRGCKVVSYKAAQFSFARSINLGASVATGELLLLLNDDMAVMTDDWLERLVWQFEKPHVGIAGARLSYPDGRIQHAGVVQLSGNPGHARYCYPRDDVGYFFSSCGVRNFLAVTGACLMTRRNVFQQAGGLSEEFPLSYNDTDYCLKVGTLGRSIVYVGDVELVHFESQTRNPAVSPTELDMYKKKWANVVFDPYYNEAFLDAKAASFELAINERLI